LNEFGSFTTGNLLADLSASTANPLSGPHLMQQSDGSVILDYRESPAADNNDAFWHILNTPDPANKTPIAASGANEIMNDATTTAGGGSAAIFEITQGGRTFQDLKFAGPNGPANEGVIMVGVHANQSQINPSITGLFNGNVAVAYENFTPDAVGGPGEHDIRLNIYGSNGSDVADAGGGSHEVLVSGAGLNALLPEIAVTNGGTPDTLGDDNIVVAWQDNNGIEFRRFTDERAIPIDQAPHTIAGSAGGLVPHLTALNDGGFMVEWSQSFGFEQDGSRDFGLVLQRFDKDGHAVGDQVIIDNPGDQGPSV
jgi:hypothetical protein